MLVYSDLPCRDSRISWFSSSLLRSVACTRKAAARPARSARLDRQWTGTWSAYNPARATAPPKELCAKLTATIAQKGDVWQAVFEGDCGQPYKCTITMEGRQAGGAVLFKFYADLGPKDGGVYDSIGAPTTRSSSAY